jgi:hypothetical protein
LVLLATLLTTLATLLLLAGLLVLATLLLLAGLLVLAALLLLAGLLVLATLLPALVALLVLLAALVLLSALILISHERISSLLSQNGNKPLLDDVPASPPALFILRAIFHLTLKESVRTTAPAVCSLPCMKDKIAVSIRQPSGCRST